jgi:hypothetical protein
VNLCVVNAQGPNLEVELFQYNRVGDRSSPRRTQACRGDYRVEEKYFASTFLTCILFLPSLLEKYLASGGNYSFSLRTGTFSKRVQREPVPRLLFILILLQISYSGLDYHLQHAQNSTCTTSAKTYSSVLALFVYLASSSGKKKRDSSVI